MACRGYYLALDPSGVALLLAHAGDDAGIMRVVRELDEAGTPDECTVDKAWDGIHRCLTEGGLGSEDGSYPLNAVVFGGLPLHQGEDYIVSYNTAEEVREVAAALATLDHQAFEAMFWTLDSDDYGSLVDTEGLDYLTHYLAEVTAFYHRAAEAGWATVFVADQ